LNRSIMRCVSSNSNAPSSPVGRHRNLLGRVPTAIRDPMITPERQDLPLMQNMPRGTVPGGRRLILASGSPRRAQLLAAAGYTFSVEPPSEAAEDEAAPGESAHAVVQRLAYQKAADVAARVGPSMVLAADTIACCDDCLLGKPADRDHAEQMIRQLSGRVHSVLTGLCLWQVPSGRRVIEVVETDLVMETLSDSAIREHLDSMRWQGKAGAFGYQDANDWLRIVGGGSPSNVVGLPMERLAEVLERFDDLSCPTA
jgi:septum formation protein